ncbi:S-formylglutathione hydrolase [Rhodobacterales bacterium 52_120_T64]|nr:S-formylglutathione hydrolase [Rhodobacterales bacterium 52_120_T64]
MKTISENASFGGTQGVYSHQSDACNCEMTFAVYMPPQAVDGLVPVVWYLSGLTCTHENAMVKAGAQAWAAEHGLAVIFPDTSPRGEGVANDEAYDLGQGAGFYVDATQEPWSQHFQMWTYITEELPKLVFHNFDLNEEAQGIMGHSMGGHGALTMAISLPDQYKSVSAFAPITNPTGSDWGRKQLTAYLGDDQNAWGKHDASLLMAEKGYPGHVMIDQGGADEFYDLLKMDALAAAITWRKQSASLRILEGYDHSYFFVSTFMEDHIAHHADILHNL